MTEDRAKKIYDQEMKVEQDYSEYLTGNCVKTFKYFWLLLKYSYTFLAVVKGDSFEDIFEKVKNVIDEHAGPDVWLPNKDRIIWNKNTKQ